MAHISTQIIGLTILWGYAAVCWAAPEVECRDIQEPTERLACYDSKEEPLGQSASSESASLNRKASTAVVPENQTAKNKAPSIRQRVSRVVGNALEVALPRKNAAKPDAQTKAVEYTISKVLRKYGGKIEYHTTDGRKFRKLGGSASDFAVGDTVVAKLGVFDVVFLINQKGTRIKVKTLN